MDASARIGSTSLTPTTARQTPRNDFGQVLDRTLEVAGRVGAALAPALGGGVVSAAVSGVSAVARAAGSAGTSGTPESGGGTQGSGEQWELLEAQRLLNEEGQRFNAEYLHLQNEMQKESREFNAVSNIMKVRHDSAKAAINNIR
ncbi:MAG: hypothetical protein L0Y64_00615 [Myxococcaceae bacterium]|nr:hypothetical protein [Myxococcaceae bacterium]